MDAIHQEIQLLKQHMDADHKALERVLERCQIHESNLEDAEREIQSLRAQINVEHFLMEKMENEGMLLKKSCFEKEQEQQEQEQQEQEQQQQQQQQQQEAVVVRDIDTPLHSQDDEQHLAEHQQLKEKLGISRQVKEERRPGSLILRRLCEKRGIVLSRALDRIWKENKHHIEKESGMAVENGSERKHKLGGVQDVDKEPVAAHERRLKVPRSDLSELLDRNRNLKNSLATKTKRNLDLQKKIQDLERQVQCLGGLVAQKEVEIYIATARLKGEREKNKDFENWIVRLGSENAALEYRLTTRNVTVISEKKNNTILCEEVQALKNAVAELKDKNAKLKIQSVIWILDLIFIVLFTGFSYFNFAGN